MISNKILDKLCEVLRDIGKGESTVSIGTKLHNLADKILADESDKQHAEYIEWLDRYYATHAGRI